MVSDMVSTLRHEAEDAQVHLINALAAQFTHLGAMGSSHQLREWVKRNMAAECSYLYEITGGKDDV